MRYRRELDDNGIVQLQAEHDASWQPCNTGDAPDWLVALAPTRSNAIDPPLPFAPLSFRDCMLYPQHWEQAARGYARRFMPNVFPVTRAYESVLGRTFPSFQADAALEERPLYYFGNHLSIVASGTAVTVPRFTEALDYELELGIVLGSDLLNAAPDEAAEAIGGFVVVNDFSARDIQRAEMSTGLGPQKCKHFISSMSREMASADVIRPKLDRLQARVEINGKTRSEPTSAGMRHGIGEVLSYLSRDEPLFAGELIATGTLPNGCGLELGRLLAPGDTLRLVIDDIGEIVHTIRATQTAAS